MLLDAMVGIHWPELLTCGFLLLVIVLLFLGVRAFARGVRRGMRDQQ